MNLLVIAGRLSRHRWSASGTIAPICEALAARGIRITLIASSIDNPEMFSAVDHLEAMTSHTTSASDWPFGFARWARRRARAISHDACLSFSRVVAGDVWMPIEPDALAWLGRTRSGKSLKGSAFSITRHNGCLRSLCVEMYARVPAAPARRPTHAIIAVGPTSAGEAVRLLASSGMDERVVQAGYFSTLPATTIQTSIARRDDVRRLLRIDADRKVIFAAAPIAAGRELDDLMRAVAERSSRDRVAPPLLLIAAKESYALHTRAVKLGVDAHVRIVGRTDRIDALIAASDIVALPSRAGGGIRGLFQSGATGRLASDALRSGRPILAASGAHGYDLARQTLSDSSRPGLVVDSSGVTGWSRALNTALDDRWLEEASRAAARVGADLGIEPLIDLLESTLEASRNPSAGARA